MNPYIIPIITNRQINKKTNRPCMDVGALLLDEPANEVNGAAHQSQRVQHGSSRHRVRLIDMNAIAEEESESGEKPRVLPFLRIDLCLAATKANLP